MKTAIIGYEAVPVGIYQRSKDGALAPLEHELAASVIVDAVAAAGISKDEIDGVVVAHPGDHTKQGYFHTFLTSYVGLTASSTVIQVLGNGMTGGHAFDEGVRLIESGLADRVLVVGVHFESGVTTADHLNYSIRLTGDVDFQSIFGAVPIAWYGLDANRYIHQYGATRADLAHVAIKNRRQAVHNPRAQFRTPLTMEEILAQRLIVDPLGLLEVPGRADGVVAFVLVSEDKAKERGKSYVRVASRGFYHEGEHQLSDIPGDALRYGPLRRATITALGNAGYQLQDVSLFQLYAPCTIVEVTASEAIGLFAPGEGWIAARDGVSAFDGPVPINTSGGCLSRGHPPEATPLYDVLEACEQLLGRAGKRQVRDATVALTMCELGKFNAALVHVLEAA